MKFHARNVSNTITAQHLLGFFLTQQLCCETTRYYSGMNIAAGRNLPYLFISTSAITATMMYIHSGLTIGFILPPRNITKHEKISYF
ncbi:MAG TPA: hypothetical protein VN843_10300 [Anaerolineales bacterium]|nr:hypothetical protein [Anaerolineales bacterium]